MPETPHRRPAHSALLWLLCAATYWLAVTLGHDTASTLYGRIFSLFGRSVMEAALHAASLAFLALLVLARLRIGRAPGHREVGAWAILLALVALTDALLVVTNIERVHYPQYALLGLLLMLACQDAVAAMLLGALAGCVDEALQYALFPQYTKYLDSNDCILNLLGVAMGVMLWRWASTRPARASQPARAMGTGLWGLTLLLGLWAGLTGRLIPYAAPGNDYAVFPLIDGTRHMVLSFLQPATFWTVAEYGRSYHILSPAWGLAAFAALLFAVTALVRAATRRATDA